MGRTLNEAVRMIIRQRRSGHSLLELVTVVVVVGILVTLAFPRQQGAIDLARQRVTQSNLRAVLLTEHAYHSEHNVYTADRDQLLALEPGLKLYSARDPLGSVRITINRSNPQELCLFAESSPGDWLAMYHSHETGTLYGSARPQSCDRRLATGFSTGDFRGGQQPDGTNGRIAEDGLVR